MIPRRTWIFAMAKAPVRRERVRGGSAARTAGFRADAQSAVIPQYEIVAYDIILAEV